MNPKKQPKQPSQLEIAEQFIKTALNSGVTASAEIKALAEGTGISKNTLDRAKSSLGVRSFKQGDNWRWEMPAIEGSDHGHCLDENEQPQEPQDFVYTSDGVLGVLESDEGGASQ